MDTPVRPPTRPPVPPRKPNDPYCSNCGYSLAGATVSAVCPECGRPLVEVLTRTPPVTALRSRRYRSEATLLGWPVIAIALGPDPERGETKGVARGVIAIGDMAIGGVALGGFATGIFAAGGAAIGVFSLGGFALGGLAALGGGAVGLGLSSGGGAIGALAAGGAAIGVAAQGGAAIGYYANGGGTYGTHTISPRGADPEAKAAFQNLSWFFGAPSRIPNMLQPIATTAAAAIFPGLLILFVALLAHARHHRRAREHTARYGTSWNPRA
jgi:hypothetical protein